MGNKELDEMFGKLAEAENKAKAYFDTIIILLDSMSDKKFVVTHDLLEKMYKEDKYYIENTVDLLANTTTLTLKEKPNA